jgi:Fe-S-cluster containining protein
MPKPNVHIAGNQNYACMQCGRCCRRFHVLLREAEVERFNAIDWGPDADPPPDFVVRIHGNPYFARTETGACVFLDNDGACSMHRRIGYRRKALTCRGYPMNIASTFWGEVSVVARMDCPAVQQNLGPPIRGRRREIEGLIEELGTKGGFTREQMEGLNRESIDGMIRALVRIVTGEETPGPGERARVLLLTVERLRALGTNFLNDTPTLMEVMPAIITRARQDAQTRPKKKIRAFSRALFREWLATYCRRDEELFRPTPGRRLRRTLELAKLFGGGGNLRGLGWEHPDFPVRKARLFRNRETTPVTTTPAAWESYRRLLVSRLEAYQFFGVSYYEQPFFTGLRALVLSYPLVLAAARIHAAAAGRDDIRADDVEYGTGAIDHCLGRSPLLQFRLWRSIEEYFSGKRFPALLHSLGWE